MCVYFIFVCFFFIGRGSYTLPAEVRCITNGRSTRRAEKHCRVHANAPLITSALCPLASRLLLFLYKATLGELKSIAAPWCVLIVQVPALRQTQLLQFLPSRRALTAVTTLFQAASDAHPMRTNWRESARGYNCESERHACRRGRREARWWRQGIADARPSSAAA